MYTKKPFSGLQASINVQTLTLKNYIFVHDLMHHPGYSPLSPYISSMEVYKRFLGI
jgi:hypothetical protein